jgi:hypothetical protein
MTVAYVGLSVFPIIQVTSAATFALKISLLIIGANVVGALIFLNARRQRATGSLA